MEINKNTNIENNGVSKINSNIQGITTEHTLKISDNLEPIKYIAKADWITLRKKEKAVAEMFYVAYSEQNSSTKRPLTFVFNGGPGAASAYLHLGAVGPKRVKFSEEGTPPKAPVMLLDNQETWFEFTDLVFIDPIGTGFSRTIEKEENEKEEKKGKNNDNKEFYQLNRDLESLGEFIQKFLSQNKRWESPVFIAGESYGGFRVACLAKRLQESFGVGLNGAILISPALELALLDPSDYEIQAWSDLFPTFAAAAVVHGKSKKFNKTTPIEEVVTKAEQFVIETLVPFMASGSSMSQSKREEVMQEIEAYLALPQNYISNSWGRISRSYFSRNLLKAENKICGLYDASITGIDPYPDREYMEGPDPSLSTLDRVFTSGINAHLRKNLQLSSERDYHLLSYEVNKAWQIDKKEHAFQRLLSATDELRYGMALNPHMKVFITHGYFDTVTPYFTSNRLVQQMRLNEKLKANLVLKNFPGGHMFYVWDKSRIAFRDNIAKFMNEAL